MAEPPPLRWRRGQATTEIVLLLPLFMFFLFAFAKLFAVLVLIQKMEIASYYAARRWQLESHRNVQHESFDMGELKTDIEKRAKEYLGCDSGVEGFLGLRCKEIKLDVQRTQVWQIVKLSMPYPEINTPIWKFSPGKDMEVVKYVPNRDRPIAFVLPGLQEE